VLTGTRPKDFKRPARARGQRDRSPHTLHRMAGDRLWAPSDCSRREAPVGGPTCGSSARLSNGCVAHDTREWIVKVNCNNQYEENGRLTFARSCGPRWIGPRRAPTVGAFPSVEGAASCLALGSPARQRPGRRWFAPLGCDTARNALARLDAAPRWTRARQPRRRWPPPRYRRALAAPGAGRTLHHGVRRAAATPPVLDSRAQWATREQVPRRWWRVSDRGGVEGARGGEPPVIGCGKELPGGCVAGR